MTGSIWNPGTNPVPFSVTIGLPGGARLVGTTPAGTLSSTNVQDALNELDSNIVTLRRTVVTTLMFGAVGDGVVDDTVAIQAAVSYCVANNFDLDVIGNCLLTASINIDRDHLTFGNPDFFTIRSINGGGFSCTSAITMFSSSLAYGTNPVSHLIRFDSIIFKGGVPYNTTAAYVFSSALFRVRFNFCTFESIKSINAPSKYVQSIEFIGCNVRGFNGIFFNSGLATYNVSVVGGLYEDSYGDLFDLTTPVGCSFSGGACLEGMKTNLTQLGTAIRYSAAQGLSIVGCYIEGNAGLDIECTGGTSAGVAIVGNIFSHNTKLAAEFVANRWYKISVSGTTNWVAIGAAATTVGTVFQYNGVAVTGAGGIAYEFSIVWGTCGGCISAGNFHTQAMHARAADSDVFIKDIAQEAVVNITSPFSMTGSGVYGLSSFMSKRTDGGYQWSFGEGASGVAKQRFGFTCENTSGSPWFDVGGDFGNFGLGAVNPDVDNGGTTAYMRKAGATAPTTSAAGGYIYVASDGSLKYKSPGGTVTTLAPN